MLFLTLIVYIVNQIVSVDAWLIYKPDALHAILVFVPLFASLRIIRRSKRIKPYGIK